MSAKLLVFLGIHICLSVSIAALPNNSRDKDARVLSLEELSTWQELELTNQKLSSVGHFKKLFIDSLSENISNFSILESPTEFEHAEQCGVDRNYLEKQISAIPREYREPRADTASTQTQRKVNVPQQCITFIMKKFYEPAMQAPKRMFAFCEKDSGRPEEDPESRKELQPQLEKLHIALASLVESEGPQSVSEQMEGIKKQIRSLEVQIKHKYYMQPCVTQEYVEPIYNAFTDVMNCFNIPQKEILPKFFNESGFHLNAYGSGKDAGVGQLTVEAIESSQLRFPYYVSELKKSKKASCQRIAKQESAFEIVEPSLFNRCNLMAAPSNPLRNLFYMAVFYKESVRHVSGITFRAGEDFVVHNDGREVPVMGKSNELLGGAFERLQIREKFAKLKMPNVNLHRLKTMIVSLGYNSGTLTALNRLNDYLNERIQHTESASAEASAQASGAEKLFLTPADFDFEKIDVSKARMAILPRIAKKDATESEKAEIEVFESRRKRDLPEIYKMAYRLTFPEFLVLRTNSGPLLDSARPAYQLYGYPGYLSALAVKNKILNSFFQKNECTSLGYLNLTSQALGSQ